MKKKSKPNWGCIIGVVMVIGVLSVLILELARHLREENAEEVFYSMADHYRSTCETCFSQVTYSPVLFGSQFDDYGIYSPYLNGKVLVVEAGSGEALGPAMVVIAQEIAASNPGEVGTLVCAGEKDPYQYSTYTDDQPGYRIARDFCVYDLSLTSVIFAATIEGTPPPAVKSSQAGPEYGTDPAVYPLSDMLEDLLED